MTAIPEFAPSVVAAAIRHQPLSPGKVALAWQMAAGPQLARASQAEIEHGAGNSLSIAIRARDPRWAGEIDRLSPVLVDRLSALLGTENLTLRIL